MEDEDLHDEIFECPQCAHENVPMGTFGNTIHYRCRMCGWDYSQDQEEAA